MKSLVMFSVNDYDSDGDIRDRGIFLNFGDTRIKVADNKVWRMLLSDSRKRCSYCTEQDYFARIIMCDFRLIKKIVI
jgi:hypothetical protein